MEMRKDMEKIQTTVNLKTLTLLWSGIIQLSLSMQL